MKNALKELLDRLDNVFNEHEELGDTEVRERMSVAIHNMFIARRPGSRMPTEFGMRSRAGDRKVRAALELFLNHPQVVAAGRELRTPEARLAAFQDGDVKSGNGRTFDEYFGSERNNREQVCEPPPAINLALLKKSRRRPKAGDVFVMLPLDGIFVYGRVIKTDADVGFGPSNLIYIYRARSKEKQVLPDLHVEQLLLPPIITNNGPWSAGYFEFLEHRPLRSEDQLSQHCFRDTGVHVGRYYDEYRNQLSEPIEPVGSWGLTTITGIAKEVSKTLGIPIRRD